MSGKNPWIAMWTRPEATIRSIIANRPTYGIYYLATIYALQSFFFYENWWSFGLKNHTSFLVTLALILSPVIGYVWLYYTGFIYYFTGKLFKGSASQESLRACIAWSKLPYVISLAIWTVLIFVSPQYVFIQESLGVPSLLINLLALVIGIWSIVLLVYSLRVAQNFSYRRAFFNVVIAWIVSMIVSIAIFSMFRLAFLLI